jgi:hypothetical protein
MRPLVLVLAAAAVSAKPTADEYERLHTNLPWVRWKVASCVEINHPSSGEEPPSPRHRAGAVKV